MTIELLALAELAFAAELSELRRVLWLLGPLLPRDNFGLFSLCGAVDVVFIVFHVGGALPPVFPSLDGPAYFCVVSGLLLFFLPTLAHGSSLC